VKQSNEDQFGCISNEACIKGIVVGTTSRKTTENSIKACRVAQLCAERSLRSTLALGHFLDSSSFGREATKSIQSVPINRADTTLETTSLDIHVEAAEHVEIYQPLRIQLML